MDESEDDEIPPDKSGFFGDFHRKIGKLEHIDDDEFYKIVSGD